MSLLKILGQVAKGAIKQTIGINLDEFKKGSLLQTKKEQKVHELAVLVTQLVVTVISLWKFVKGSKTVKSIENEKR